MQHSILAKYAKFYAGKCAMLHQAVITGDGGLIFGTVWAKMKMTFFSQMSCVQNEDFVLNHHSNGKELLRRAASPLWCVFVHHCTLLPTFSWHKQNFERHKAPFFYSSKNIFIINLSCPIARLIMSYTTAVSVHHS